MTAENILIVVVCILALSTGFGWGLFWGAHQRVKMIQAIRPEIRWINEPRLDRVVHESRERELDAARNEESMIPEEAMVRLVSEIQSESGVDEATAREEADRLFARAGVIGQME